MPRGWWTVGRLVVALALLSPGGPSRAAGTPIVPRWSAADWAGVPTIEQALFDSTNAERRKRKLPALKWLEPLQTAARQHSQEMLDQDYFSHTSPVADWTTPALRAWMAGFWEAQVGENIVMMVTYGYTATDQQLARELMYGEHGWMNSPGHRENILNKKYTHLGLGVAQREGRTYATQVFANPSYELSDLRLSATADGLQVTGRVTVITSTPKLWQACDSTLQGSFPVKPGKTYPFTLTAPRDGARHRLGLHPAIDNRGFWVKFLFWLDTAQPPNQALVSPWE